MLTTIDPYGQLLGFVPMDMPKASFSGKINMYLIEINCAGDFLAVDSREVKKKSCEPVFRTEECSF